MVEAREEKGEYCKIPVGPHHPALKEPINFTLTIDGEIVVSAEPRIGYVHRGIERLAQERTYPKVTFLVERICGICSGIHQGTYCMAVEELSDLEVPERAVYLRTLIWELERLHSHSLWLGVAAHEIGFDTLFMYTWRDREHVMDLLETITGNRVNYGMCQIGGVRSDISEDVIKKTLDVMDFLEKTYRSYKELISRESTILARLKGVGPLSEAKARELCAVGPTARASNVDVDIRRDDPYGIYDSIPFNVITYPEGDLLARTLVRIDEMLESIKIIRWVLKNLPDGPISVKTPRKYPEGEVIAHTEAPRGELFYYIQSDGRTNKPVRVKVRTPTLANLLSITEMLKGAYIADVPIVIAGIDPCISCMDRVLVVKENTGEKFIWTEDDFRRYSRKWYKIHYHEVVRERCKR